LRQAAHNSTADYLRFLRRSRGSLAEIRTPLFISKRLGYLPDEASTLLLTETEDLVRQLTALYTTIERSSACSGSIPA
jgi:four helix bundle protein